MRLPRRIRFILGTLLASASACGALDSLYYPEPPADAPGVVIPDLFVDCLPNSGRQCAAWSPDSKTIYVIARVPPDTALLAVDVAAAVQHAPSASVWRTVARAGSVVSFVPSPNGQSMYVAQATSAPAAYSLLRMSLADGSKTPIVQASRADFLLTPDGTGLVYHTAGGTDAADTVAILDLASGTRRASSVGALTRPTAVSPDGQQVALLGVAGDSLRVWHVATGARVAEWKSPSPASVMVRWMAAGFTVLAAPYSQSLITLTTISTGQSLSYDEGHGRFLNAIGWSADGSRMFVARDEGSCYHSSDCSRALRHYLLYSLALAGPVSVGSVNDVTDGYDFPLFELSPDGKWLVYNAGSGRVYVLPAS